jgi:hypothetical protein
LILKLKYYLLGVLTTVPLFCFAQNEYPTDSLFWHQILIENPNPILARVLSAEDTFKTQLICTQIKRSKKGHPTRLINHYFEVNDTQYFYPASTVKLPTVLVAINKINELSENYNVSLKSKLIYGTNGTCQVPQTKDDTNLDSNKITLEHFIKRIFLVSDNSAYNRLYEFNGIDYAHRLLESKGYKKTRVIQRFWNCDSAGNCCTNPIVFTNDRKDTTFFQSGVCASTPVVNPLVKPKLGNAFMGYDGKLYPPMELKNASFFPLADLHQMFISLVYPKGVPKRSRFNLKTDQRKLILDNALLFCTDSKNPVYDAKGGYYPTYKKYFFYGRDKNSVIDSSLKIYNIVGWAYGTLIDCAYIQDTKSSTDFFLTAYLYCNKDEVINDNLYNYDDVGFSFLKNISIAVRQYMAKTADHYINIPLIEEE